MGQPLTMCTPARDASSTSRYSRAVSEAEPLRILWVASKLSWAGGIGRVLAGGSQALAERGHEVHVAGAAPDGDPAPLPGYRPTRGARAAGSSSTFPRC